MRIELNEQERNFLLGLLEERLGDVRDEIYKAESHDFKEQLRIKKELIASLLDRLRRTPDISADRKSAA